MNLSEEWRFLWPTSHSSHAPPLLPREDASSSLGPLLLRPLPATLTPLLSSQSLSPPSFPPLPTLSLPRFLETSSSVLPTTSNAISAALSDDPLPSSAPSFASNRLEPLPFPDGRSTLAFFPTGDNADRVGFVVLSVSDSQLRVKGDVILSPNSFGHRILQLAAREASEDDDDDCVGFLMASTMYSVNWFRVSLAARGTNSEKPVLVSMGSKLFKSSCVAHVCWSPHLPEESLVLLESGKMFLFDVNVNVNDPTARFRGKRLPVSWDEHGTLAEGGGWLSCEFSWHPRILVAANSDAVFLVDFRGEKCSVDCVMKVGLLGVTAAVESDRYLAFSKAGSDGFYYVVASQCWLVLFDIRAPCKRVLQWMHSHECPLYVSVFRLSRLRGDLGNDEYNQASEMGYAAVLGSFWTGDFSLFCYGPSLKRPVSSNKPIKASEPFYAWDLPSELLLSGLECPCSSCLLREELAKDGLPEVEWQQKKQLVLGFFILDKAVSSLLSNSKDDAGFMLIRLMSSGKLESQRYSTCWDMAEKVESAHVGPPLDATDLQLCSMDEEEYGTPRKSKYMRFKYLHAYMNGSLTDVLLSEFKSLNEGVGTSTRPAAPAPAPAQESISNKAKTYGVTESAPSYSVSDVVKGISLPTSIHEAASKRMWSRLPMSILGRAFSTYEEECHSKKAFLDLSAVPDQNQLPPFTLRKPSGRSNKGSKRVRGGHDVLGPAVPLPVSLTLEQICENGRSDVEKLNGFSADAEVTRESQDALRVSRELSVCDSNIDDSRNKSLYMYKPSAFSDALADVGNLPDSARYTTMIANVASDKQGGGTSCDGSKMFDDLCRPFDLKFEDSREYNVGPKEMQAYAILTEQFKKWQNNFKPYSDFCKQFKS